MSVSSIDKSGMIKYACDGPREPQDQKSPKKKKVAQK